MRMHRFFRVRTLLFGPLVAAILLCTLIWVLSIWIIAEVAVPLNTPGRHLVLGLGHGAVSIEISQWAPPRNRQFLIWTTRCYAQRHFDWLDDRLAAKGTFGYESFSFSHPVKSWTWNGSRMRFPAYLPLAVSVVLLSLPGGVLWARHRRDSRRLKQNRCIGCGYNLTGIHGPRCPECGSVLSGMAQGESRENPNEK